MHGHGAPAYTNIQFPFAVEPPHVPEANPIGDHLVGSTAGPEFFPHALLRFDGIESAGTVWLNGMELGTTRGSRLAHEFDVSGILVQGSNTLAVRVAQFSAASYVEDQDMWWLPGIFRDVTLQARPADGIDDVFVHAEYDPLTGEGVLQVEATGADEAIDAVVRVPELDLELPPAQEHRIPAVGALVGGSAPPVRGDRQHRRGDSGNCSSGSAASPSRTRSSRSTAGGSCCAA